MVFYNQSIHENENQIYNSSNILRMLRDKPLALYIFSAKDDVVKMFKNNTSSGGMTVNDSIFHIIGILQINRTQ